MSKSENLMGRLQTVMCLVALQASNTRMRTEEVQHNDKISACGDLTDDHKPLIREAIQLEFGVEITDDEYNTFADSVEVLLNRIERALNVGYVTITPNYNALCTRFAKEIVPATKAVIRELQHRLPHRGLNALSFATAQQQHMSRVLQDLNSMAVSANIALGAATSVAEIEFVREALAESTRLFNEAFRKAESDLEEGNHIRDIA